ncbi:primosomal protein N' [Corynebacterium bovis]|uniref:primosomal protein N' n=1 Tax=Corynebacterium bovis TaxID=36808 RepID=UPI002446E04E|nr:primosomal protein N' [Corynebacterium bovis]MDH2455014.1 primosomal protein N' [Corynebacterium bovis]
MSPEPAPAPVAVPSGRPVAHVLPLIGVPHLDRGFDYAVPPEMDGDARPGVRVRIRFAGRLVDGIVLDRRRTTSHAGELAPLRRVLSPAVVVPERLRDLVDTLAERYAGVRSDIIRAAVPPRHAAAEKAGLYGGGAAWEDLYGSLVPVDELTDTAVSAAREGWGRYVHGGAFVDAALAGRAARAAWLPTPREDWALRVAELTAAVAWSGGGVLVVVPTVRDVTRVRDALRTFVSAAQITTMTAGEGPAARYRSHLAVLAGQGRVVVGTRSAALAPVVDLRLIVLTGEAEDALVDPRAPYIHAREVLRLRSAQEGTALVVGDLTRSAEVQRLVEDGELATLRAPRETVTAELPWTQGVEDSATARERDPHAAHSRVPSVAFTALRAALDAGRPGLVSVPRRGYAPSVACATCRTPARCRRCNGPLELPATRPDEPVTPRCRWCGRAEPRFTCTTCGGHGLRMTVVGQDRTVEELGRAFPGVEILASSGARPRERVGDGGRLVVATPGVEPLCPGYGAAVILDPWLTTGRADLRARETALRQWSRVASLVVPRADGGRVVVAGDATDPTVQQLIRWDPEGAAARELRLREEAAFPPAVVMAAVDGTAETLAQLEEYWQPPDGTEVLGPVPLPPGVRPPAGLAPGEEDLARRMIVRTPTAGAAELGARLRTAQAQRSTHRRTGPLRVVIDPVRIG